MSCKNCGKEWDGWDAISDSIVIDGEQYCTACKEKLFETEKNRYGRSVLNGKYWRIGYTFSSLFDGPHEYYSSVEKAIKGQDGPVYAKHFKADPMFFNPGYGLSGHIDREHWKLYHKVTYGNESWIDECFAFTPSEDDLQILNELLKGAIE